MTITEERLWEWMMRGNYPPGYPDFTDFRLCSLDRRAFATLARDTVFHKWQGHGKKDTVVTIPAGAKVKVVMASRLGDVGITDNLEAHNGYHYRVGCITDVLVGFGGADVPIKPEELLLNIEPIEDPREDKVKIAFPDGDVI